MATTSIYQYDDAQSVIDLIDRQFTLGPEKLISITKGFLEEMELGLANYGKPLAMIPTFVSGVPDGSETGTFLALDLGGTNLRVCEVVLNGDKTFSLVQQKFKVSETLKTGEAKALFDYIADSVDAFLTTHATTEYNSPKTAPADVAPDVVYLGFTFSFPVDQTALGAGKILTWTKGFSTKNAVGHDVVQLLQDAFNRKNMHVKCVALVNDTVGTLLTHAYTAGGSHIGAIFGTGTNGAYVEDLEKIKKYNGPANKGGTMIINCEWGAFNNSKSHLPITPYDNTIDRLSINPGFQVFEKFISGMYLGETARQIILSLVDAVPKPILFGGASTGPLNEHYGLDTSFMSKVEDLWIGEDKSEDAFILPPLASVNDSNVGPKVASKLEKIKQVIVEVLGYKPGQVTLRDAAIVRWICFITARRAGLLSGLAVAAILVQTNHAVFPGQSSANIKHPNEIIGVGVDGSLVEHYPNFQQRMRESIATIIGSDTEKRVNIGLAKDGSGVGAALCALQALKQLS
ncbi:hexokinase [Coprinopsis marcescibilis]|uniref:Phosphotransferase n=1 Tax=Coprinopsis marcescibilis TaxID=230819 RepID=A0A5C3L9Y8_COPMA|nr:hexokinase [Coprinopsis marcescibilis]